jgi:glycosyltransferase involved in cell wall biosynthesis
MTQEIRISVVIPVGTGSPMLGDVLLHISRCTPLPYEVIIVNDRVSDGSLYCVAEYENTPLPVIVVPNRDGARGPASARNTGAKAASGDVLLFIDSDVMLPPDFFSRLESDFSDAGVSSELRDSIKNALEHIGDTADKSSDIVWSDIVPQPNGILGVQSSEMIHRNPASVYKNHWMRFTYLRLEGPVHLFYTSAAAIYREDFFKTGGFDEEYITPSVEDTAFGRKLAESGTTIYIDKELEYEHRKKYDSWGVLKTDFERAAELARLVLREGRQTGGNRSSVPTGFILSLPVAAAIPLWIVPLALFPEYWVYVLGGYVAHHILVYFLNVEWLGYVSVKAKPVLGYALLLLPLEANVGFWGGVWGVISYLLGKKY